MARQLVMAAMTVGWIGVLLSANLVRSDTKDFSSVFGAIFDYKVPAANFMEDSAPENSVLQTQPLPPAGPFSITEEEFTALRIEYIKNQILRKLRLKEKPQIAAADLPRPLKEYENLLPGHGDGLQNSDDFYAKTTQAVIFPYEERARCLKKARFPSSCLPFQMPSDIHASDVSTAELWFHKLPDVLDPHNQTFVISEVAHWDTKKSFQKTKPIAIHETNIAEGWLSIDVTYIVKNWLEYQDSPTHAINVVCKTCGMDKSKSPLSFETSMKPFLVIYTHSQQRRAAQHRRHKRSLHCESGLNECCRESLYISFAEIGWDDWIIKPAGYNAYFCKGSCTSPSALTLSASQHNSILQKIMFGQNRNRAGPEITPCCAATQYQPLQLVYMDNNRTLTTKLLTNMIVDSCGCL